MILSMRHVVVFAMFAMGLVGTVGCHGVDHTGRSGMVGRLVDASGQPISGQRISSLEAEGVTQEDGSFSVAWKDPETAVFFDRDGVHWQRRGVVHHGPDTHSCQHGRLHFAMRHCLA